MTSKSILFIFILCSFVAINCVSSEEEIISLGEGPMIKNHFDQNKINDYDLEEIIEHGEFLFKVSFNELDGLGRPETSGTTKTRPRRESPQNFNRISGPDANACVACHNLPRIGGGGDNSNNVFGLASDIDFATLEGSVGSEDDSSSVLDITNERNTIGVFGSGLVELLSREITSDLLNIVEKSKKLSIDKNKVIKADLESKGINYGYIEVHPNGFVDRSNVDGIDSDLILRPFIQKGVIGTLRDFSNISMNHHHGMQSEELAGLNSDLDRDGIVNELTEGDITAVTIFQATLDFPDNIFSENEEIKSAQLKGKEIFNNIGCASCHMPTLPLKSLMFVEPGPLNTEISTTIVESKKTLVVNLEDYVSKLDKDEDGNYLIPIWSDLKRHDMGSKLDNERPLQKGVPTNYWLTKKLWGFYSEPPFLHHGRANLLNDVIEMHQGDAKISSDAYFELDSSEQQYLIEFLKSFK
ncbi:MAG: di-heme oxidoredictase family protein [Chloroflexota bacterium]|nr:di-heme oxidoredictase family protein [Chloroflexota bacterium]